MAVNPPPSFPRKRESRDGPGRGAAPNPANPIIPQILIQIKQGVNQPGNPFTAPSSPPLPRHSRENGGPNGPGWARTRGRPQSRKSYNPANPDSDKKERTDLATAPATPANAGVHGGPWNEHFQIPIARPQIRRYWPRHPIVEKDSLLLDNMPLRPSAAPAERRGGSSCL